MNSRIIFWGWLCSIALIVLIALVEFAYAQDIPYHYGSPNNRCNQPQNDDSWGIRRPTAEEALEHGSHVLVFWYLNNKAECSDSFDKLGIRFEGERILLMTVNVLGQEEGNQELVTIDLVPNTQYTLFSDNFMYLEDSDEEAIIILYPAMF